MFKKNKTFHVYILFSLLISNYCFAQNTKNQAIESYLDSLSEAERVSQVFLVNIEGKDFYKAVEDTDDLFNDGSKTPLVPGGVLLFSYNIADSAEELIKYNKSIAEYCDKNNICRPYVSTDQEGGLVNRLKKITSYLPSNQKIGSKLTPQEAFDYYKTQALQMKALGFDMNLAPVSEGSEIWNEEFLGSRSFGSTAKAGLYSLVSVKAYEQSGVGTVVKHFPGNTNTDPHTGLPEIKQTKAIIYKYYIVPFAFVLQGNPSGLLMSHARTQGFDDKRPACLSNYWVEDILKGKLGYKGLVLSDDIFMGALADNGFPPEVAAIDAINAGVDIIMLSEKRFAEVAQKLLSRAKADKLFEQKLREAEKKVILFKIEKGILYLTKDNNGNYIVKPASFEMQGGSVEERLNKYSQQYKNGVKLYNRYF